VRCPRFSLVLVRGMVAYSKTAEPKLNADGLWQNEVSFAVRLPVAVREDLAAIATRMGIPSSILVRRILTEWLLREGDR
jgi:hypothetical protein